MILAENINEISAVKSLLRFAGYDFNKCPVCDSEIVSRKIKKIKCSNCGSLISWRTGTCFEKSKLSAAQLLIMFDRFDIGKQDNEVSRELGIFITTVKAWRFVYEEIKNRK